MFTFVAVKSARFDFNVFMTGSVLDLVHSASLTVQLLLRGSDLQEAVSTSLMQVYARNQSSEHNKQVVCLIFTYWFSCSFSLIFVVLVSYAKFHIKSSYNGNPSIYHSKSRLESWPTFFELVVQQVLVSTSNPLPLSTL